MKSTTYLFLVLNSALSLYSCCRADARDHSAILRLPSETAVLGQPIYAVGTFSNSTAQPVLIYWIEGGPGYPGGGIWGTIQISTNGTAFDDVQAFHPLGGFRFVTPIVVPPLSSTNQQFTLLSDRDGALLFPRPGSYWMRARFHVRRGDDMDWVSSELARIEVEAPTSNDLAAWKLLKGNTQYLALIKSPTTIKLTAEMAKNFESIVHDRNQSAYAPGIALSLGRQESGDGRSGGILNLPSAKAHLKPLLMLTNSETVQRLAVAARENVASMEQWQLQQQKNERKLIQTNLYRKAVAELEAQWYDVKGFVKSRDPEAVKFRDDVASLMIKHSLSDMSGAEFDRAQAILLREHISTNLIPLDPDEWRRRQNIYAQEDLVRATAEEQRRKESEKLDEEIDARMDTNAPKR